LPERADMNNQEDRYGKIYDICEKKLNEANESMAFSRKAFLYSTRKDIQHVNMEELEVLDNKSFLELMYVGFFFRPPEKQAREHWEKYYTQEPVKFRKNVFWALTSSREFVMKKAIVQNGKSYMDLKSRTMRKISHGMNKLYFIYRRLPEPMQKLLKKMLKR